MCFVIRFSIDIQCAAPANGEITSCSSGRVGVGYEGDTCSFTCNTGYELTGSDTRTCQSDGSWSEGLPSCVPLTCLARTDVLLLLNAITFSPCSREYQSKCTVSCDEGFTGDDVTYLCDVTSDTTIVRWVPIGGEGVMCERGLLT